MEEHAPETWVPNYVVFKCYNLFDIFASQPKTATDSSKINRHKKRRSFIFPDFSINMNLFGFCS